MRLFKALALLGALLIASPTWALLPTLYVDTAGNGAAATDSGTTDNSSASLATCTGGTTWLSTTGCHGTAASWTTSTTTVTLDTNTNLQTPFPIDGSQFIFLTNATNTNQKIFSITGITGCTGSGSCTVTISVAATCATCTAQNWTIGGRILLPDAAVIEGALLPGTTLLINTTTACGGAACLTFRTVGDAVSGPITIRGKGTGYPTLSTTGNFDVFTTTGTVNNVLVTGLTLSATGTSAVVNYGAAGGFMMKNNHISGGGTTALCITGTGGNLSVIQNEITGCGNGAVLTTALSLNVIGNYIHANTTGAAADCITDSSANPTSAIVDNILSGCARWGLNYSGASSNFTGANTVEGNVFYNNGVVATSASGNLNVTNADTPVRMYNNIFYDSLNGTSNVVFASAANAADPSIVQGGDHQCNDFFVSGTATNLTNIVAAANDVTTDPQFTNAAGGNFAIATAGGAFAVGCPQSWPNGSTTSFRSIGAMQLNGIATTVNSGIVR